jgi:hypothetical protein
MKRMGLWKPDFARGGLVVWWTGRMAMRMAMRMAKKNDRDKV